MPGALPVHLPLNRPAWTPCRIAAGNEENRTGPWGRAWQEVEAVLAGESFGYHFLTIIFKVSRYSKMRLKHRAEDGWLEQDKAVRAAGKYRRWS